MLEFGLLPDIDNPNLYSVKRIENHLNGESYNVLVDSGASIPVWVDGLESFQYFYSDAIPTNYTIKLKGFGGDGEDVPVYILPEFHLSDGTDRVVYHRLPIAIIERDFSVQMIISFPMIERMNYNYVYYSEEDGAIAICNPPLLRLFPIKQDYNVLTQAVIDEESMQIIKMVVFAEGDYSTGSSC